MSTKSRVTIYHHAARVKNVPPKRGGEEGKGGGVTTFTQQRICTASNFIALLELNSKGLYQSSGKEKESSCLLFPSSTKREIRQFHFVVVQRPQRNKQKSFFAVLVAVAVAVAVIVL